MIRTIVISIGLLGAIGLHAASVAQAQTAPPPPDFKQPSLSSLSEKYAVPARSLADVPTPAGLPSLTVRLADGAAAHMVPTVRAAAARAAVLKGRSNLQGPLLYHAGGRVVYPYLVTYHIFWAPPKLQTGVGTGYSTSYPSVQVYMGAWITGHSPYDNNTQYYQTIGGVTNYIQNAGGWGGYYVDTAPYPASGCSNSATPGNCVTDTQIRAEIQRVMTLKGWTGGYNKMFLLYTSSGEGSCFDASSTSCANVQYCAYHSYFNGATTPIIYGNEPYPQLGVCTASTTPNNDVVADTAASIASHEINEATTDPLLNAWFDDSGNEIGDLCNFNYGANTWDGGLANQMWNGTFFELQQQWSNNKGGCVQSGP